MFEGFAEPLPEAPDAALGEQVIFLVSLPQSGADMTTRILAAHPQVGIADALARPAAGHRRGVDAPRATVRAVGTCSHGHGLDATGTGLSRAHGVGARWQATLRRCQSAQLAAGGCGVGDVARCARGEQPRRCAGNLLRLLSPAVRQRQRVQLRPRPHRPATGATTTGSADTGSGCSRSASSNMSTSRRRPIPKPGSDDCWRSAALTTIRPACRFIANNRSHAARCMAAS